MSHLELVVEQGYAVDDEENDEGVRCISAPVREGRDGPVIGCIGIDGPSVRITPEGIPGLAALVVDAATDLSAGLEERPVPADDMT